MQSAHDVKKVYTNDCVTKTSDNPSLRARVSNRRSKQRIRWQFFCSAITSQNKTRLQCLQQGIEHDLHWVQRPSGWFCGLLIAILICSRIAIAKHRLISLCKVCLCASNDWTEFLSCACKSGIFYDRNEMIKDILLMLRINAFRHFLHFGFHFLFAFKSCHTAIASHLQTNGKKTN